MIIPGILEEKFEKAVERIVSVDGASSEIQIDIADGKLVEGKTFLNIEKLKSLNTKSILSLHFMVKSPSKYLISSLMLSPFVMRKIPNVNTVITQVVSIRQLKCFIKTAKNIGYKVGVSLNYNQEPNIIGPLINKIDLVQFMSVVPGKQGNDFIPEVLEKIKRFKLTYPTIKTQIDGGVNTTNLTQVLKTGVDNVIIGSAIFNSENPRNKVLEFIKAAHGSTINN